MQHAGRPFRLPSVSLDVTCHSGSSTGSLLQPSLGTVFSVQSLKFRRKLTEAEYQSQSPRV